MIPKVLLASDSLSSGLLWNLRLLAKQLAFVTEPNISQVVRRALDENPDLIVLELNPRNPKGMDVIRELREVLTVPLLILFSIQDTDLVLKVYEAGADDCIVNSIDPVIFLTKVNAWLRRCMSLPAEMQNPLRVGTVHLIPLDRVACLDNGAVIQLTVMETRLLYVLMSRAGRTFRTEELINTVWKENEEVGRDILKTLVYRLRHKLEAAPAALHCILTIPRVGYKFDPLAKPGMAKDGDQDKV